jgi:predicted phosphoadenosine phosphosulfate sulfurtransferase
MGTQLTDNRREEVWHILSDAFLDTEISYWRIARRLEGIEISQVEKIFFSEVAPICGVNGLSTIPLHWACFNKEDLVKAIRDKLATIQHSPIALIRYKFFVKFCRWFYKDIWDGIAAKLYEYNKQNQA